LAYAKKVDPSGELANFVAGHRKLETGHHSTVSNQLKSRTLIQNTIVKYCRYQKERDQTKRAE